MMLGKKRKPAPPSTPHRAYLRGRLRAAGLLDDKEAQLYTDPALPTPLLAGFVLGALAADGAPLLSESALGDEVKALLSGDLAGPAGTTSGPSCAAPAELGHLGPAL